MKNRYLTFFLFLCFILAGSVHAKDSLVVWNGDTLIIHIDPDPYDLFYIDSSITVNDGYTYTSDSLVVMSILKANGWDLPVKDSTYAYIKDLTVDKISATVNGRIVKLNLMDKLVFIQWASFGRQTYPPTNIPSDIGKLTALQYLEISSNKLDLLPSEIGDLSNLIVLRCDGNLLKTFPSSIGNLKKLCSLSFIGNLLTEIPSTIGELVKLTALQLRDNNLIRLPDEFGNFPEMEGLTLSNNKFTSLPPKIGAMRKLKYLDLNHGDLESLPNEIGRCDSLRILFLRDNQIARMPDSIVNLQYCSVWIDSNHICNQATGPVQEWMNLHCGGKTWQCRQRCSEMPPSCDSSTVAFGPIVPSLRPERDNYRIYTLTGAYMGTMEKARFPKILPPGVYIIRNQNHSKIKVNSKIIRQK